MRNALTNCLTSSSGTGPLLPGYLARRALPVKQPAGTAGSWAKHLRSATSRAKLRARKDAQSHLPGTSPPRFKRAAIAERGVDSLPNRAFIHIEKTHNSAPSVSGTAACLRQHTVGHLGTGEVLLYSASASSGNGNNATARPGR